MTAVPESTIDAGETGTGTALGVLMALVPCTTAVAQGIIDQATRTIGGGRDAAVEAVLGLRRRFDGAEEPSAGGPLEVAVREEMERVRTSSSPITPVMFPTVSVLRQHVTQVRALRRRTLATPADPMSRAELENALYTLCLLTGRRGAHAALTVAEEFLAAHRQQGPRQPA